MRFKLTLVLLLHSSVAFAHSGGLDSQGGHHDRKNGGYHFHRNTSAPVSFTPRIFVRTQPPVHPRRTARLKSLDPNRTIVYVTRNGKTYHSDDCRSAKNAVPMQLADAAEHHKPCPICHPPTTQKKASPDEPIHKDQPLEDDQEQRERKAAAKLLLAKRLLASHPIEGKKWLEAVIKEYPDTQAARKAEELLATL